MSRIKYALIALVLTVLMLAPIFYLPTVVAAPSPEQTYMKVDGVLNTDKYALYPYFKRSLNIGFSKYGEMINPEVVGADGLLGVGLEYKDEEGNFLVDPFAPDPSVIPMEEWSEGWYIKIIYYNKVEGQRRCVWAYALFTDFVAYGGDWIEVTDYPWDPRSGSTYGVVYHGGRKTNGTAYTEDIRVIYDGPRMFIAQSVTHINDTIRVYESPIEDNPIPVRVKRTFPLVDVIVTVIFNKVKKAVILIKDIKMRIPDKEIGPITYPCICDETPKPILVVKFSQRSQWDTGPLPRYQSYAHWYHKRPTCYDHEFHEDKGILGHTYDLCQIISEDLKWVGFAAFWPSLYAWTPYGWDYWYTDISNPPVGPIREDDMPYEPEKPYVIGEWFFYLSKDEPMPEFEFPEDSGLKWGPLLQYRTVTVYGITDLWDADDLDINVAGFGLENRIDKEVWFQLEEIFEPWDLRSAAHKEYERKVEFFHGDGEGTLAVLDQPIWWVPDDYWGDYCVFDERVINEDTGELYYRWTEPFITKLGDTVDYYTLYRSYGTWYTVFEGPIAAGTTLTLPAVGTPNADHRFLVPDSEKIVLQEGNKTLKKGLDYEIDYDEGTITMLIDVAEDEWLEISYSYKAIIQFVDVDGVPEPPPECTDIKILYSTKPKLVFDEYIWGDGAQRIFKLGNRPVQPFSELVYKPVEGKDYLVDYQTGWIELEFVPKLVNQTGKKTPSGVGPFRPNGTLRGIVIDYNVTEVTECGDIVIKEKRIIFTFNVTSPYARFYKLPEIPVKCNVKVYAWNDSLTVGTVGVIDDNELLLLDSKQDCLRKGDYVFSRDCGQIWLDEPVPACRTLCIATSTEDVTDDVASKYDPFFEGFGRVFSFTSMVSFKGDGETWEFQSNDLIGVVKEKLEVWIGAELVPERHYLFRQWGKVTDVFIGPIPREVTLILSEDNIVPGSEEITSDHTVWVNGVNCTIDYRAGTLVLHETVPEGQTLVVTYYVWPKVRIKPPYLNPCEKVIVTARNDTTYIKFEIEHANATDPFYGDTTGWDWQKDMYDIVLPINNTLDHVRVFIDCEDLEDGDYVMHWKTGTIVFQKPPEECHLVCVHYKVPNGRYEWAVAGRDAASIDALALSMVTAAFKQKHIEIGKGALDIKEVFFGPEAPFLMAYFADAGEDRTDYYYSYPTDMRTAFKNDWCHHLPITSSNIITVGGPYANLVTEYFNEFIPALVGTTYGAGILGVTCLSKNFYAGGAPEEDTVGYAVIATYKDINGTIGFVVYGWTGQDTYYAAAMMLNGYVEVERAQIWEQGVERGWVGYIHGGLEEFDGSEWFMYFLQDLEPHIVAIILKFDYTKHPTDPDFCTVVELLGTISEKWPHSDP